MLWLKRPAVRGNCGHAGPILVAATLALERNFVGGSYLRAPVGGSENETPRNWRTLGAFELMNPVKTPVLVLNSRVQLEVVRLEFWMGTQLAGDIKAVRSNINEEKYII